MQGTAIAERIGLVLLEAMLEHGISERRMAAEAGVSRYAVHRLARGASVSPDLVTRIGVALIVRDVFAPPVGRQLPALGDVELELAAFDATRGGVDVAR